MKWALRRYCSERDYFMFVFGINMGLGISDIVPLKVGDVRGRQRIDLIERKSGKRRNDTIEPPLAAEIDNYTKGMDNSTYLFSSRKGNSHISETQAYRALVKAGEMIDRKDIGTHTMRKTFGYHHYKRNKDVALLKDIFSHAAPSITLRYIGVSQDDKDNSKKGFFL